MGRGGFVLWEGWNEKFYFYRVYRKFNIFPVVIYDFVSIIDLKTQLEQLVDEIEVESMLWMFLFIICMIGVFGKLLLFGIQMAWGISKFLLTIVILPLILIGMVVGGLLYIAFPILIVIGIITLFCR